MDEAAFHATRSRVVPLPCVFQAAMQARQIECECLLKRSLAERESLGCAQATAHLNCETLERLFLERATFPLHLHPGAPLTHATVMRLHCGGLHGLREVLGAQECDVHRLVTRAQAEHGSLVDLPWGRIVPFIVNWQPRRRGRPLPS